MARDSTSRTGRLCVASIGVPPSGIEVTAVVVLLIAQFMANMDTSIANLATPSIGATMHANGIGQQWVVAAYVLTSAMFMITAARLSTVLGDRSVFLSGIVVFTLASLACGVAPTIAVLIAARGAQGIGAAMMVGQVLSGIKFRLQGEALTRAISAYTVALSLSAAVGQVAGGAIVTANFFGTAWRPLFLLNVPIGVALLAVALWRMDNRGRSTSRAGFDVWGALILAIAMLTCVLPLNLGFAFDWPHWAIASLIVSAGALVVFTLREKHLLARGGLPLIDLRLFSVPGASAGIAAMAITRVVFFSLIFVMALYLQTGLRKSAFESGLSLLTWMVAYGVSGPVYPIVPRRFLGLVPAAGCLIVVATFFGLAALHGTGAIFLTLLGIAGFAFGLLSTGLVNHLAETVSEELSANLSGLLATIVPLTAAIGVATFGSIYITQTAGGNSDVASASFAYLCVLFGVAFVLAAVASAMAMRERFTLGG